MTDRYLEDVVVGQTFGSGRLRIDKERIKAVAADFDPQPFHLGEEAARDTSSADWPPAVGTPPRSACGSRSRASSSPSGIVGAGFDEFRWPRPVRPGDELRVESEVLEVRRWKSRPEQGLIKVRTTTLNQNGEPVQVLIGNLVVPRRPT